MSERLPIVPREATMAGVWPGGARAYEDSLVRELEQAAADEARLRREGMEAAMQRALDRSGWYNVGQMMLPQDPGEAAIGAAMVPGPMGLGMRAVLAGLGGMTTQPSDAEGMMLPRSWFESLLRSRIPAARREGERALDALSRVERNVNIDALRWADPADQNRIFQQTAPETWREGWLPYGNDRWMGALDPQRNVDTTNFNAAVERINLSGRPETALTENLVYDPAYFEGADRALNLGLRGRYTRLDPTMPGGYYSPGNELVVGTRDFGPGFDPYSTFRHELNHSAIDRAGLNYMGNNSDHVWAFNRPELRNEYLQDAGGDVIAAADRMYFADPGEWLARLGARMNEPNAVIGQTPMADDLALWPDFRIR